MQRESVCICVRNSKNSEDLVRGVAAGLAQTFAQGDTTPVDLHLIYIAISFVEDEKQLVDKAVRFVERRFQPHLSDLPAGCCWHVHLVSFQRPLLSMDSDEDALIAYSLCRKAARLGSSELVLKGNGEDSLLTRAVLGPSIAHLCSQWSSVPTRFWSRRKGWRLQEPRGVVPPGHSIVTWRRSLTPAPVPVIDGQLVQQPDGNVHAIWLDRWSGGARFGF